MAVPGASAYIPPQQQRSRETLERILASVERLLVDRRFDELSINDICIEAEVSQSSLYARFANKDAIRIALVDRVAEHVRNELDSGLELIAQQEDIDLESAAREMIRRIISFNRSHDHLLMAIIDDESTRMRFRVAEREVTTRVLGTVTNLLGDLDRKTLDRAQLAMLVCVSAIYRGVGSNVRFVDREGLTDDEFADELARMAVAYLRAP